MTTYQRINPQPPEGWNPGPIGYYEPTRVNRKGEEYPGRRIWGAADEEFGAPCPYRVASVERRDGVWFWAIELDGGK